MPKNLKIHALDTQGQTDKIPYIDSSGTWTFRDPGAVSSGAPHEYFLYDSSLSADSPLTREFKTLAALTTALNATSSHRIVRLGSDLTISANTSWAVSTHGVSLTSASPGYKTSGDPLRKLILSGNVSLKGVVSINDITVEASYNSTTPIPCFLPPNSASASTLYLTSSVVHNVAKPLVGGADASGNSRNVVMSNSKVDFLSIDAIHETTPTTGAFSSEVVLTSRSIVSNFAFNKRSSATQSLSISYDTSVDLSNIISVYSTIDATSKSLLPLSYAPNIAYQNRYAVNYFDDIDSTERNIEKIVNSLYEDINSVTLSQTALRKSPIDTRATARTTPTTSADLFPDKHSVNIENEEWVFFRSLDLIDNDDYIINPTTGPGSYVRKSITQTELAKLAAITATYTTAKDTKLTAIKFIGFEQGLASARPVASSGLTDCWYFATDTLELSRCNGTIWTLIATQAAPSSSVIVSRSEASYRKQEFIYNSATAGGVLTITDPLCTAIIGVKVEGVQCADNEYTKTSVSPFTVTMLNANTGNDSESVADFQEVTVEYLWDNIATITTTTATVTNLATIAVPTSTLLRWSAVVHAYTANMAEVVMMEVVSYFKRTNVGNITQLGGAPTPTGVEDSAGSPTITMDADTTTQTARLRVTGEAAKTYTWKLVRSIITTA